MGTLAFLLGTSLFSCFPDFLCRRERKCWWGANSDLCPSSPCRWGDSSWTNNICFTHKCTRPERLGTKWPHYVSIIYFRSHRKEEVQDSVVKISLLHLSPAVPAHPRVVTNPEGLLSSLEPISKAMNSAGFALAGICSVNTTAAPAARRLVEKVGHHETSCSQSSASLSSPFLLCKWRVLNQLLWKAYRRSPCQTEVEPFCWVCHSSKQLFYYAI